MVDLPEEDSVSAAFKSPNLLLSPQHSRSDVVQPKQLSDSKINQGSAGHVDSLQVNPSQSITQLKQDSDGKQNQVKGKSADFLGQMSDAASKHLEAPKEVCETSHPMKSQSGAPSISAVRQVQKRRDFVGTCFSIQIPV